MKKLFTILAVAICSTLAMAQTNQYFWAGGQFIMGNPINQIDSITFGQLEQTDSVLLYLPRTVKVIHDTVIQYVTIHDTINPCAVPEGAISGKFSVSDTKQVYFSQGNLQYQASTDTWRFAENQWKIEGDSNQYISVSNIGWIDLFGWGTGNNPLNTSLIDSDYPTFYEWGNNFEEGIALNNWRTLSSQEWIYIFSIRENADSLYSQASIDDIHGMIVFPDNWTLPANIQFTAQANDWNTNVYTKYQWNILESLGAVFLPAAGTRNGTNIGVVNYDGNYWSSTNVNENTLSIYIMYNPYHLALNCNKERHFGFSVRLVQDVK